MSMLQFQEDLGHLALLDSGANKSVIGSKLAQKLVDMGCVFGKTKNVVHTADGQTQMIVGLITVPLTYHSVKTRFEFLIPPTIRQ